MAATCPNDRVHIWKAVKYCVMPLSMLTHAKGVSDPTEIQSGAGCLGQYASLSELKVGRPFSDSSGELSPAACLFDAFAVGSAATDRKMKCNKNLFPIHHERSTYSLTEQINDAYVAFMHYRRQKHVLTLRSYKICCLILLDSTKMDFYLTKNASV